MQDQRAGAAESTLHRPFRFAAEPVGDSAVASSEATGPEPERALEPSSAPLAGQTRSLSAFGA
jgi:hypothetical protein